MSTTSGSRDYGRFDELAEEFAERYRRGERPSLQEYVDRLPEMAEEIREMFPAMVEVERADGDARGDVVRTPPIAPHPGQIGDYRIVREVGRGGMGVVYEAEQVSLGRRVALKVLPGHVTGDRQALERFRREAKSAARLHHTNIVPVFEVGRDRDVSFYAMQLIQGQGLDQVFEELRRLREPGAKANGHDPARSRDREGVAVYEPPQAGATSILQKQALVQMTANLLTGRLVAEGSEGAATGAIAATGLAQTERFDPAATSDLRADAPSRELPTAPTASGVSSSAMMPGGKHVSEVDTSGRRQPFFRSVAQIGRQTAQGLAYAHARGIVHRDIKPSNLLLDTEGVVWITDFGLAKADDDGMTASGDILGTLRYMAPERFRGEGDARADLYALGLTLYELLTLRPAYDSSDRLKLIEQIKNEEPVRPRSIDNRIPRDMETIVLKAIDKDPERRYASAEALAEDLRRFLADEPIRARQVSVSERYWRWARRNPAIAALGAVLTAVLVLVTVGSLVVAGRMAALADNERSAAFAERQAREEARRQAQAEAGARGEADLARAAAQAETYRAMLSEVKALRAGHQLGWRDGALGNLARLAIMPTPRRDLFELRSEAVASIGELEVKEVARFEVSGWTCSWLDFSPDSRTLVTASNNGDISFWDVPGREHRMRLAGAGLDSYRGQVRFLPDGELAFLAASGGVAFLSGSGLPSTRATIERDDAKAVKLGIDRRGRSLVVGWNDGRIDLIEAGTNARQQSLAPWRPVDLAVGPGDPATRPVPTQGQGPSITPGWRSSNHAEPAFSPDGTTVAGVMGRSLVLWDIASKRELMRLGGHKEGITGIAFSPDGEMVATTCGDSMTRIWDARDGRALAVLPGPWYMRSLTFSPDGAYLAAAADPGPVCLYRLKGRREQRRLVGHTFGSLSVAFHPSLPRLVSSSDDNFLIVWDTDVARPLLRWLGKNGVTGLAYSPNGALIATSSGANGTESPFAIRLWNAQDGTKKAFLQGHQTYAYALAFDPTGHRLASGDIGGAVLLWDASSGRILRRENAGGSAVRSVVFHKEGRQLLAGLTAGDVVLFELEPSGPTRRIHLPDGCMGLVLDRGTNRAIVGDSTGALIALSLPDLAVVRRLDGGHDGAVAALAVSPDGRLLVTSGMDRHVVLRDAATFEALLTFPAWTGVVRDCAFDPSGRWLALAGSDSDVALWDLRMVRDELATLGLAWDQPTPTVASAESLAASIEHSPVRVPLITPGNIDPAEYGKARGLINSGVEAFRQGRPADAVADLQQASERLETLRKSHPSDPMLASQHGLSLGFLASSLAELKRPGEALARSRESLAAFESMTPPQPNDLYNMACACAMISALDERGSAHEREKLQARAVGYLRGAIEGDQARLLPQVRTEHDLDPLRNRADFRDLMADMVFPRDPFVEPSPLSRSVPETLGAGGGNTSLARKDEGHAFLAAGLTLRGLPVLASALANDPNDRGLLLEVATLQAWFGQGAQLAATSRRALEFARDTTDPSMADITAKICCLRPSDDRAILDPMLALARRAVTLGKDHVYLPYFRMALGMAEYRSGNYAAAHDVFLAVADASKQDGSHVSGTSAFYLAMSLFRQGKEAEARRIATDAILQMRPLPADEENPLIGGVSTDDLILWMAFKEARALLNLDAAPASRAKPKGR